MRFEGKHYAILAAMLVAIGTQLASLEHGWHDAMSPGWIGGLCIQIGTTLAALFVGSPSQPQPAKTREGVIDRIARSVP